jgi:murein DD-endopeptidase MepM/ murein hydrolase activator NlpD
MCRALILVLILAGLAACQPPPSRSSQAGGAPESAALPPPGSGPARWHPDTVVVLPAETLYAISRRYDVPIRAIIDANRLEPPYRLRAGQTLTLPQVRTHLVRAGDTLYSVSRQYGVDVATLAESNHLQAPFTIRTGTVLVLPPSVGVPSTPAAPGRAGDVSVSALPPPAAASAPSPTPVQPPPAQPPTVQPIAPPTPVSPPPTSAAPRPTPAPSPAPAPSPPPEQSASLPPAGVPARGEAHFMWPVEGRVIAHYGPAASGTHNDGINIAAPTGTPVLAADAGTVAYAGNELRGYGNLILIKHANGWMTAYAHNSVLLVKRGDKVRRGQAIARVGATGTVSEPQLHFEVRKGTRALDPTEYLAPRAASG